MPFDENTKEHVITGLANEEAAEDLLKSSFIQDALDIIGKGQGVNKTTTTVHGITVTEDFGVNDELFLHWQVPILIDLEENSPELHMEFAPVTAEVEKVFSLQINISKQGNSTNIGDLGEVFDLVDISIPEVALQSFSVTLELPEYYLDKDVDDLHIKIKRVASSNDLVGDIALHHASMEYFKHLS